MGWFSTKTTIYVSSVMYNLGGDYDERTDYMKFLVVNNLFAKEPKLSMAEGIVQGSLTGPGIKLRSFYRWANIHYPESVPNAGLFGAGSLNMNTIALEIPADPGKSVLVSGATIGIADYREWSDAYMQENYEDLLETNWFSTIGSDGDITITFEDLSTESFTPTGFDKTKTYLYVRYAETTPTGTDELTNTGPTHGPFSSSGSLPDLTDFTFRETIVTTGVTKTRHETVTVDVTYSDATPPVFGDPVVTDIGTMSYDKSEDVYFDYLLTIVDPSDPAQLLTLRDDMIFWQEPRLDVDTDVVVVDEDIGGGVTMTTTTTTVTETFAGGGAMDWFDRTDSYEEDIGSFSKSKLYVYAYGTGNTTLDDMFPDINDTTGYFPVIPVRINGDMITHSPYNTTMLPNASAAYKKLTGGKLTDMMSNLTEHNGDHIEDIDFAYIVQGVPLNTRSNESRRYIYEFFKKMIVSQLYDEDDYDTWVDALAAYNSSVGALYYYYHGPTPTVYTEAPELTDVPEPKKSTIRLSLTDARFKFANLSITWNYAKETTGSGLGKVDAKVGDIWIVKGTHVTRYDNYLAEGWKDVMSRPIVQQSVKAYFQHTEDMYTMIEIIGLQHVNMVYEDKKVYTTSDDALDDDSDSDFIIPLHYEIFKRIPIVTQNQIALECGLIVMNCYVERKTHWYDTWLFKLVLIIAVVLITALVAPEVLLAGGGLFGANLAIGATVGLAGLSGAIFGAITNAIVASIVVQLLSDAAISAFGPKLGGIISAVLGFVIANPTLLAGGAGGALAWSNLFRPENLLALTSPIAGVYTQILTGKTADTYKDLQTAQEAYQKRMDEIHKLTEANLGSATEFFNPLLMTDVGENAAVNGSESSAAFLSRTLLTGSDIAAMTMETVYSFCQVNTSTPLLE